MRDLYRIVYTSYRKACCDDDEIKKILNACQRNNPARNITGVLLHAESRFIQYIEGSRSELLKLYELIKQDDRHTNISQRDFTEIESRVFPSWQMGYLDLSSDIKFNTDISASDMGYFNALIKGDLDFSNDGMRILRLFFKTAE